MNPRNLPLLDQDYATDRCVDVGMEISEEHETGTLGCCEPIEEWKGLVENEDLRRIHRNIIHDRMGKRYAEKLIKMAKARRYTCFTRVPLQAKLFISNHSKKIFKTEIVKRQVMQLEVIEYVSHIAKKKSNQNEEELDEKLLAPKPDPKDLPMERVADLRELKETNPDWINRDQQLMRGEHMKNVIPVDKLRIFCSKFHTYGGMVYPYFTAKPHP